MPDSLKIWGTDYTGVVGFKAIGQTNGPTGKNLYNPSTRINGYYLNASGTPTSDDNCSHSNYIAVTPGENYVWSGISSRTGANNKRAVGYNASKSYVQVVNNVSVSGSGVSYENSFTVPSGVEYIRLSFNTADSEMMVEHGATKTSYEPYTNLTTCAYLRPQGTKSISQNGTGIDVAEYATVNVNVSSGGTTTIYDANTSTGVIDYQSVLSGIYDPYHSVFSTIQIALEDENNNPIGTFNFVCAGGADAAINGGGYIESLWFGASDNDGQLFYIAYFTGSIDNLILAEIFEVLSGTVITGTLASDLYVYSNV